MAPSSRLKELVAQMPEPDKRGMFCTGIDKEKIQRAIAEIAKGGREDIIGLIDMLVVPGEGDDVKAHYALHCLAIEAGKPEKSAARREFAQTLASQLGPDRPKPVQAYLIQEIQVTGGPEVAADLGKLLADEELNDPATRALLAIKEGAAEQFRAALPRARGKCRLAILLALGKLRDAPSVGALQEAIKADDREIRIAAAWGLANIGDAGSADLLTAAAEAQGWERIQNTKACLLLAERLLAAGDKPGAEKIYRQLRDTRTDRSERYIRDAAEKALAGGA